MKTIATLITCHNRREKTLACIKTLFNSSLPQDYKLSLFLVDDGSIDGTSEVVKEKFPMVIIIQGTGNLFWNQGMRLAWTTAVKFQNYDFYLWLNDDTLLHKEALLELIECYNEAFRKDKKSSVIVGGCKSSSSNVVEFSYGGSNDSGPVIPNGILQTCKFINGNVVLISKEIYDKLGNLSPDFTHAYGDYDYSLKAIQKGFNCYTSRKYIAICDRNNLPIWCNPQSPLLKRIRCLFSTKGLNMKEYIIFRRRYWGWLWIFFAIKALIKAIIPRIYTHLSGSINLDQNQF